MSVRIEVGNRRYTTNVHDAAVKVARGDAKAVTDAGAKEIEEYLRSNPVPNGKKIAEKKAKHAARRAARVGQSSQTVKSGGKVEG